MHAVRMLWICTFLALFARINVEFASITRAASEMRRARPHVAWKAIMRAEARLRGGSEYLSSSDAREWDKLIGASEASSHLSDVGLHAENDEYVEDDDGLEAEGLEAEGEDNEALNAATFGDAADDEQNFVWDNVALASEALKTGIPVPGQLQPSGAAADEEHSDADETQEEQEQGKREWLPLGDDTPVEYIADSLYLLAEQQRKMIEEDLEKGGPGEAPDLSELFAQKYPEHVAPTLTDWRTGWLY
jgi:hypothetical protein